MDLSQFRDSGELSDLTIIVDGKQFNLHKFPMYIKSEYFRAFARENLDNPHEKIDLENFPGGASTFEEVANYCYNMRIELKRENICKLRCAADFLKMESRGNLADTTDRYITDILTSAKLSRDFDSVAELLLQCKELGNIAEEAKIVDKCLATIVDCWLLTTRYTKNMSGMDTWTAGTNTREKLFEMPLAWFLELFQDASDKSVRPTILADLVQSYINFVIDGKMEEEEEGETEEEEQEASADNDDTSDKNVENREDFADVLEKATASNPEGEEESETPAEELNDDTEAKQQDQKSEVGSDKEAGDDQVNTEEATVEEQNEQATSTETNHKETDVDAEVTEVAENKEETDDKKEQEDASNTQTAENETTQSSEKSENIPVDAQIAVALDSIIPELTKDPLPYHISPHWALRILKIADANGCKCLEAARTLVSRSIYLLPPQDLAGLPEDMLVDIVRESCKDDENAHKETACRLVDIYLSELAAKEKLTVDTFNKMVEAVPKEHRFSHDTLFSVLEALLLSENIKLTDEEREELLKTIDYSRLSEEALFRAYESELVPQNFITKAALELCSKLRAELEEAKRIIKARTAAPLGMKSSGRYSSRSAIGTSAPAYRPKSSSSRGTTKRREPTLFSSTTSHYMPSVASQYMSPTSYSSPGVPSLASDAELQMVLDSLDKTSEIDYPFRTSESLVGSYRSPMLNPPPYEERYTRYDDLTDPLTQSLPVHRGCYYNNYRY